MLRVQRYVDDINKIIDKTKSYGRDLGIVGKYLKINIINNIRNYLDMIRDRRDFSREELIIIIKEFNEYLDYSLIDEYYGDIVSMLNMKNDISNEDIQDIQDINFK